MVAAYVQGVARLHDDIAGLAYAGQCPRQPLAVPLHQAQQIQVAPLVRARDGPDGVLRIAAEDLAEELTQQHPVRSSDSVRRCEQRRVGKR